MKHKTYDEGWDGDCKPVRTMDEAPQPCTVDRAPPGHSGMTFFVSEQISENISKTPEGFLLCANVPLTRTGDLLYAAGETPVTAMDGVTVISRTAETIFSPETIASFQGKPVTINHPKVFVDSKNIGTYGVGTVINVRPGVEQFANCLVGDLLITHDDGINVVQSGVREVSLGYEAEYTETAPGKGVQTDIRGNHVALVDKGRAGPLCAIRDSIGAKLMELKNKYLGFKKTVDEANSKADLRKQAADLRKQLAEVEKEIGGDDDDAKDKSKDADKDEPKDKGKTGDSQSTIDALTAQVAALTGTINTMVNAQKQATDAAAPVTDQATVSAAEILSPGIAKVGDVKSAALRAFYATDNGKAVLHTLTGGVAPAYDSAPAVDMLFRSAAEIVKVQRTNGQRPASTTQANDGKTVNTFDAEQAAISKMWNKG